MKLPGAFLLLLGGSGGLRKYANNGDSWGYSMAYRACTYTY